MLDLYRAIDTAQPRANGTDGRAFAGLRRAENERRAVEETAAADGVPMSTWIRVIVLRETARRGRPPGDGRKRRGRSRAKREVAA